MGDLDGYRAAAVAGDDPVMGTGAFVAAIARNPLTSAGIK